MSAQSQSSAVMAFLIGRLSALTKHEPTLITGGTVLVDVGLQSIDAVLLCGEVEDQFEVELDPATIFEHETLGSFASDIEARLETV